MASLNLVSIVVRNTNSQCHKSVIVTQFHQKMVYLDKTGVFVINKWFKGIFVMVTIQFIGVMACRMETLQPWKQFSHTMVRRLFPTDSLFYQILMSLYLHLSIKLFYQKQGELYVGWGLYKYFVSIGNSHIKLQGPCKGEQG